MLQDIHKEKSSVYWQGTTTIHLIYPPHLSIPWITKFYNMNPTFPLTSML